MYEVFYYEVKKHYEVFYYGVRPHDEAHTCS